MNNKKVFRHPILRISAALAIAIMVGSGAIAQDVSYDVDFSTDVDLMMDPFDSTVQHFAVWKSPTQMLSLRSAPLIRLTNTSPSNMSISEMTFDLDGREYDFDSFMFLEQPDNGTAVVTSHADSSYGGDKQNFITIEIPDGLAPGDSLMFQVRLMPQEGNDLPDFNTAMWDSGVASFDPDRADNTKLTVEFKNFQNPELVPFEMSTVPLFEYPRASRTFPMQDDGTSGFSLLLNGGDHMQNVIFNRFSQTAVVPEPTSIAMLVIGILGFTGISWRRRRANRAA